MPTPEERLASIEASRAATWSAHNQRHCDYETNINQKFDEISARLKDGGHEIADVKASATRVEQMLTDHCKEQDRKNQNNQSQNGKNGQKDIVIRIKSVGGPAVVGGGLLAVILAIIEALKGHFG